MMYSRYSLSIMPGDTIVSTPTIKSFIARISKVYNMGNQQSTKVNTKSQSFHTESRISDLRGSRNQNNMPYQSNQFNFRSPQRQNGYYPMFTSQVKDMAVPVAGPAVGNNRQSLTSSSNTPIQSLIQGQFLSNSQLSLNMSKPSFVLPKMERTPTSSKLIPPTEAKEVRIVGAAQLGASILQKDRISRVIRPSKPLTIENKTIELDELRTDLRVILKKITQKYLPEFDLDISKMSEAIEQERQQKLKDRNKVVFLLKQRTHYEKICSKFKDYSGRIKTLLRQFRKKDSVQQITQQEITNGQHIKAVMEKFVKNIETDLPQKGWKVLIQQPGSKFYQSTVTMGIQDPEIMKKFYELEQSLINPQILERKASETMLTSITRRVGDGEEKLR